MMSTSSMDFPTPNQVSTNALFRGMNFNGPGNGTRNTTDMPISTSKSQQRAGAALYADPQDMAFAQSSHSISMSLPDFPQMDDQMFWSNMDSNLFDVFGAVSWETMTGPTGVAPMASNSNSWDMSNFGNTSGGNLNDSFGGNGR